MESGTPAGDIMRAAVGDTVTNIFEILAVVALFATMTILQLTGVRVLWSQARDGQMPAAEWLRKVDKNKVPINTTYLLTGFAVLFAVWSSLLSVLAATAAFAWAAAYTLVVFSGLYGVIKKLLPERPFSLGGFQVPMYLLASVWSLVLLFAIVKSDVVHVGRGAVGLVVAGLVLYALIPSDRRGKIVGVTHAHDELV
jgi:amino acid transporter